MADGSLSDCPTHELHEKEDFWITSRQPGADAITASIVIPTYRAERTLQRAVRSALDQTLQDIEVIVVDDASGDSSWDLILELQRGDPRVRGIRNKRNCGKPVGMNRAIAHARGRWLAVLDADDWYRSDRLATLVAAGETERADLVADNQYLFDAVADRTIGTAWPAGATEWRLTFDDFLAGSEAYESFGFGMLKPVLRTDFIRRTGLSYEEEARNGQDFFYLLQFYLFGGRAIIVDDPCYHYTQPFGRESRRWSHAARRRYDFATAYHINQRYLTEASATLTPAQRSRLNRRSRQLRSLEIFFQARECLAAHDPAGAIARIAHCPAVLGYVLRRIQTRLSAQPRPGVVERIATRARRHEAGLGSDDRNSAMKPALTNLS